MRKNSRQANSEQTAKPHNRGIVWWKKFALLVMKLNMGVRPRLSVKERRSIQIGEPALGDAT
ncbi:protein of unknown function [Paraburkholderia kururiensis]